MKPQRP